MSTSPDVADAGIEPSEACSSQPKCRMHWPLRSLQIVIVALLLGYLVWNSLYYFPYIVDDTFISLRYARNLLNGAGLVYNVGQQVEGYSNFSWVMIEALVMRLGLPVITSIKLLGLASAVATALLAFLLARRVLPKSPEGRVAGFIAFTLICLNTSIAVWSQAGLETVFFASLVVAMCLRFEVELDRKRPLPWSAVLFALACMTRPEAPVYGLYFLVRRVSAWRRVRARRGDLLWVVVLGALLIPYEAWGLWYYGKLLPNTYAAKIGLPNADAVAQMWTKLFRQRLLVDFVTRQGWGFVALLSFGALGGMVGFRRLPTVVWVTLACGLLFVIRAGNDWMPRYRLIVPIMPFLFILVSYGFAELLRRARRSRVLIVICCLAFAASLTDYARHQMFAGYARGPRNLATETRTWRWCLDVRDHLSQRQYPAERRAWRILRQIPAGETICARDIGFIGFLSDNPIWDLAGLLTPTVARARHDRGEEAQRLMFEEMLALEPAYILLRSERPFHQAIEQYLQNDPRIAALYRRRGRGRLSDRIIYTRRKMARVDFQERVYAAVRQFPEYEKRAKQMLAR